MAFANIYKAFAEAMLQLKSGTPFEDIDKKHPDVDAGVHGVRFINKCLESLNNGNVWVNWKDY